MNPIRSALQDAKFQRRAPVGPGVPQAQTRKPKEER